MTNGKAAGKGAEYNAEAEKARNLIGTRIQDARKELGWSLVTMVEHLKDYGVDVGRTALNKWENGDTVPSAYQFLAVCRLLGLDDRISTYMTDYQPELNAEGRRLLAQYRRDLICSGNYRPESKSLDLVQFREMKVAYIRAAAGTGNLLDDDEAYEMVSFPEGEIKKGADVGIRISGDSMEPVYHDGQTVWVQKCDTLNPGEVGIFDYDGRAYIKLYQEQEPGENVREHYTDSYGVVHRQPVLISYNKAYDPIEVSPSCTFRVFGKVLR